MSDPSEVEERLERIRATIATAARRVGRDPAEITLVAAAKSIAVESVAAALDAGVRAVGHNYVQELRTARAAFDRSPVRWHYIGTMQSGAAAAVADLADVVQTLSGERAARRLAGRAVRAGRSIDALVEVDLAGRGSGVRPDEVATATRVLDAVEGIHLRGLMTIPPPTPTAEGARPWFRRLRQIREDLSRSHPDVVELSMGMSLDYAVAVEEGATMVRIGTALFGSRRP